MAEGVEKGSDWEKSVFVINFKRWCISYRAFIQIDLLGPNRCHLEIFNRKNLEFRILKTPCFEIYVPT